MALQRELLVIECVALHYTRVYGPHSLWQSQPESPAISTIVPIPGNIEGTTDRAVDMAYRQRLMFGRPAVAQQRPSQDSVTVEVTDASAQMISVRHWESGSSASFAPGELWPGVDGRRLVKKKMQLTGTLAGTGSVLRQFHPDRLLENVRARAIAWIGEGRQTLVRVEGFTESAVIVLLHPDLVLKIPVREGQDPAALARLGQVISVYAMCDNEYIEADFSSADAADSLSVLPGGPPWLVPEPEPPTPAAEDITEYVDDMAFSLEEAREQVAELTADNFRLKQMIDELRRDLRATQRDVPRFFSDEERQLRYELEYYYLLNTTETDRASYPWPTRFELGPVFIKTFREITETGSISRRKVLEKCAHVLSSRDFDLDITKPWKRPGASQEVRADGGLAYRTDLEGETPGSRRLKYWRLTDGRIELDSVGHHDEGLR